MSRDTSPEVAEFYESRIMALTPGERLQMCSRMFDEARILVHAGLLAEPNPEGHTMSARMFLRLHGSDFEPAERERIVAYFNERCREHDPWGAADAPQVRQDRCGREVGLSGDSG